MQRLQASNLWPVLRCLYSHCTFASHRRVPRTQIQSCFNGIRIRGRGIDVDVRAYAYVRRRETRAQSTIRIRSLSSSAHVHFDMYIDRCQRLYVQLYLYTCLVIMKTSTSTHRRCGINSRQTTSPTAAGGTYPCAHMRIRTVQPRALLQWRQNIAMTTEVERRLPSTHGIPAQVTRARRRVVSLLFSDRANVQQSHRPEAISMATSDYRTA
jgi:hypothetical protein